MTSTASTRREFLRTVATSGAAGLLGATAIGCSGSPEAARKLSREGTENAPMKLSLSVRIAESFTSKRETTMTLDELINQATSIGYEALCMRASQGGIHTPPDELREMKKKVDQAGLRISMVTGDFAVPQNDEHGPDGLRNIKPYLDLADILGTDLIRICMKVNEDIPWAQRAADAARERGIRLAHQSHLSSLFETVEGSHRVLKAVDRENFGIIYEPANWMLSGQDYGAAAIHKLRPWIFNVYLQNHRLNPDGEVSLETWSRGTVRFDHIGLWNAGGVASGEVFKALHEVGYRGYVTVHQAFAGIMSPEVAARKSYEYLKPLASNNPPLRP